MMPDLGIELDLSTLNFSSILDGFDVASMSSTLDKINGTKTETGYIYSLNLMDIGLPMEMYVKIYVDKDQNLVGFELPETELFGINIYAKLDINDRVFSLPSIDLQGAIPL